MLDWVVRPGWAACRTGAPTHSSGPACPSNDGGRKEILRYDTPAIGPASLAVSAGNNDYFDIMLKVAGSFGDAGYDLRIGHIGEYDEPVAETEDSHKYITGKELRKALAEDGFKFGTGAAPSRTLAGNNLGKTGGPNGCAGFEGHEMLNKVKINALDGGHPTGGSAIADTDQYLKTTPGKMASEKPAGDVTTASAAVSFGQGTSVAVAWSKDDTKDHEYQYGELDHSYGDGSIGVYYKTGEMNKAGKDSLMWTVTDAAAAYTVKKGANMNHEGSLWGIGIGHSLGGGATAYAGYRQISEDGMKDIDLLLAGMRVTFN